MGPYHPEIGHFEWREVKRGPWVPVRIWYTDGDPDEHGELQTDQNLCIQVADELQADPWAWWRALCARSMYDISTCWDPLDEPMYRWRMGQLEYDRRYMENAAVNRPRQPVDWMKLPPQV